MQEWIPDTVWLEVVALSATDALRDLPDSVTRNDSAWRSWYDNEAPERTPIPDFQTRITKFTRMCIVKVGHTFWDSTLVTSHVSGVSSPSLCADKSNHVSVGSTVPTCAAIFVTRHCERSTPQRCKGARQLQTSPCPVNVLPYSSPSSAQCNGCIRTIC